jgi:hypothetical protein
MRTRRVEYLVAEINPKWMGYSGGDFVLLMQTSQMTTPLSKNTVGTIVTLEIEDERRKGERRSQ